MGINKETETLIIVSKETRTNLKRYKLYKKETYNDIIIRLMKNTALPKPNTTIKDKIREYGYVQGS